MKRSFMLFAFLVLTFPVVQPVKAQDNSWPLSPGLIISQEAVASHFLAFAQGYAASRGYRISEVSQRQLFGELLNRAPALASSRDAQIAAEEGLIRFVDAMIAAGGASPGSPFAPDSYGVVGERNFAQALRSLCPIWPVCD